MSVINDALKTFTDPQYNVPWGKNNIKWIENENKINIGYPIISHKNTLKKSLLEHLKKNHITPPPNLELACNINAHKTCIKTASEHRQIKNIIGIGSCKGGVGKSTVSGYLAWSLAKMGLNVGLLDADVYGPNIPILFDQAECVGEIQNEQYIPVEALGVCTMSIGYLVANTAPLAWRGPIASQYSVQMFTHTRWPKLDYLLIDLPPGTGDIHLSLYKSIPFTAIAMVTTHHPMAITDTYKGIKLLEKMNIHTLGLIENMVKENEDSIHRPPFKHPLLEQMIREEKLTALGYLPWREDLANNIAKFEKEREYKIDKLHKTLEYTATKMVAELSTIELKKRGQFPKVVTK